MTPIKHTKRQVFAYCIFVCKISCHHYYVRTPCRLLQAEIPWNNLCRCEGQRLSNLLLDDSMLGDVNLSKQSASGPADSSRLSANVDADQSSSSSVISRESVRSRPPSSQLSVSDTSSTLRWLISHFVQPLLCCFFLVMTWPMIKYS